MNGRPLHLPDGRDRAPRASGFTMLEMIVVLTIAFLLLGIAAQRLIETSARVAVPNARSQVTSAVSLARATSTRYGRTSYLVVDAALDRLDVRVDTSETGDQPPAVLHEVSVWDELWVDLQASYPVICFDPRGFSPPGGLCPGTTVVLRLSRDAVSDSVVVSTTGRVSR